MKFLHARTVLLSVTLAAIAVSNLFAQNADPPGQQPAPAPDQQPRGKVIFSRSIDENGETNSQAGPAAPPLHATAPCGRRRS